MQSNVRKVKGHSLEEAASHGHFSQPNRLIRTGGQGRGPRLREHSAQGHLGQGPSTGSGAWDLQAQPRSTATPVPGAEASCGTADDVTPSNHPSHHGQLLHKLPAPPEGTKTRLPPSAHPTHRHSKTATRTLP